MVRIIFLFIFLLLSTNSWAYRVTASALSEGGKISPPEQTKSGGQNASFTITPFSGYSATVTGTCGGLPPSGSSQFTYTTSAVAGDCTVLVSFTPVSGTPQGIQIPFGGTSVHYEVQANSFSSLYYTNAQNLGTNTAIRFNFSGQQWYGTMDVLFKRGQDYVTGALLPPPTQADWAAHTDLYTTAGAAPDHDATGYFFGFRCLGFGADVIRDDHPDIPNFHLDGIWYILFKEIDGITNNASAGSGISANVW